MSLVGEFVAEMMASAIRMGIPILLAALGAIFSERSGVINIGLEGMMMFGAFFGALGSYLGGPVLGLALAIAGGTALAFVHAMGSVTFRVNQIVSGVALNILAYGCVRFSSITIFKMATTSPHVAKLASIDVPSLSRIPVLRPLFGGVSPMVPLAVCLALASYWLIQRTVFGLRLRAVGENPLAADTVGVPVPPLRYVGVLLSGALAGLAGAYLSIEHTGMYVEGMTQGKGYIALAATIFGDWSPLRASAVAMLFGFAESLSFRVVEGGTIPYQFIKMIPYAMTLAVLAGVVGRSRPPASSGVPYEREGE
ncbi:MAG: ABC transporter permease [Firmicutes bacterium]|jgi:simple sugar transport system permease protein|nr:ABC transporter permease [Bacillota bacterium]